MKHLEMEEIRELAGNLDPVEWLNNGREDCIDSLLTNWEEPLDKESAEAVCDLLEKRLAELNA